MASFMSRFYASDSDSDSSDSSDEAPAPTANKPRWASSDEEEEKRVVKSKDEKFQDEIRDIAVKLKNKRKNNDWVKVEEFADELFKLMKSQKKGEATPRAFLKAFSDLEDSIEAAWPKKKDLNKLAAKALNTLRQKLRKVKQEMTLESVLVEYRKNPDASGEEEAPAESAKAAPAKAAAAPGKGKAAKPAESSDSETDDEDDVDWGSSDTESESDEEVKAGGYTHLDFLKTAKAAKPDRPPKDEVKSKPRQVTEGSDSDNDERIEQAIANRNKKIEKPLFSRDEEITTASVLAKLTELLSARGRKGTSPAEQMSLLVRLRQEVVRAKLTLALEIKVLLQIIAAHFDDPTSVTSYMSSAEWHQCQNDIMSLLVLLINNENLRCDPTIADDQENLDDTSRTLLVRGSLVATIERLDDEYIKALQALDPHAPEYVDRLKDEGVIYNLICLCERYVGRFDNRDEICNIKMRRIEHIYYKRPYKPSPVRRIVEAGDTAPFINAVSASEEADVAALMARLCKELYGSDSNDRCRTRAMLCQVYHLAIYDHWFQARDLLLMSHLQDSISHADPQTQILFNRTMVQLGLCAFRNGMISAAQNALNDIWSGGRIKELLAQGIMQRKQEKSPDEIKNEKKRQVPFHMHINVELIECVYYVSSMLLEIPHMAESGEASLKIISKPFRRQMDYYLRQVFNGPPENSRDHIMAAACAMKNGDWKTCEKHVLSLSIWAMCPNSEAVKTMLRAHIKEESLRTYLFAFSGFYDSMSLETLSQMFEISIPNVHSIISKMIINEELQASHDQPTSTIVVHKAEPSPLQSLALQFTDKVVQLVENNERLNETPSSVTFRDRLPYVRPQRRDGPSYNASSRQPRANFRTQGRSLREQQYAAVDAAATAAAASAQAATSNTTEAPRPRKQWS